MLVNPLMLRPLGAIHMFGQEGLFGFRWTLSYGVLLLY